MEDEKLTKVTLTRTGQRPLTFEGRELATGESRLNNAHPDYSGRVGKATTATVYETRGGKLVLEVIHWTIWQGQTDEYTAHVYDGSEALLADLEHQVADRVARDLLLTELQAKMDIAEHVA